MYVGMVYGLILKKCFNLMMDQIDDKQEKTIFLIRVLKTVLIVSLIVFFIVSFYFILYLSAIIYNQSYINTLNEKAGNLYHRNKLLAIGNPFFLIDFEPHRNGDYPAFKQVANRVRPAYVINEIINNDEEENNKHSAKIYASLVESCRKDAINLFFLSNYSKDRNYFLNTQPSFLIKICCFCDIYTENKVYDDIYRQLFECPDNNYKIDFIVLHVTVSSIKAIKILKNDSEQVKICSCILKPPSNNNFVSILSILMNELENGS